jgi:hypothetical protein
MVDAQTISVATGVVGVAIPALGLLLNWYRRKRDRENFRWIFVIACAGIFALTAAGVTLTFLLGSNTESPADAESSEATTRLTEMQYESQLGVICSDAKEKARQIQELQPRETVLGTVIEIERDEVSQIARLRPPDKLKNTHADMLSVWRRRVSLLESVYHQLPQLSDSELAAQLTAADHLAAQLAGSFQSLGVPECII